MAISDNYIIAITSFIIGLTLFLGYFWFTTFSDNLLAVDEINESETARNFLTTDLDNTKNKFDGGFAFVFFMTIIIYFITVWLLGSNPIFIIIHIVLLLVGIIISFFVSDVWETISGYAMFGATTANMPITNHILSNLPIYVIIFSMIGLILMFGKPYIAGDV